MNEELQLGALKPVKDYRKFQLEGIIGDLNVPKSFKIEDKFPVKNQYSRGSCTAQAYAHHKERHEGTPMSATFAMAETKKLEGNTDYGAHTANQFKIGNKKGTCAETMLEEFNPEVSYETMLKAIIDFAMYKNAYEHRNSSYWFPNPTVEGLKRALVYANRETNNTSVVISMNWFKCFNKPTDGVLTTKLDYSVGGHAVDLIGYDDDIKCYDGTNGAFYVKNSWGNTWGKDGYFYIPYSLVNPNIIWEGIVSLDIPKVMPVDNRYGKPRNWASYLLEKQMALNPWLRAKIKRLPNNREISALVYGKWDYQAVFEGRVFNNWLHYSKAEYNNISYN